MADVLIRLMAGAGTRGFCRGCRQPIQWVPTLNGKVMPLDADAVPVQIEGGIAFYRASAAHWGSCAARERFQRRSV